MSERPRYPEHPALFAALALSLGAAAAPAQPAEAPSSQAADSSEGRWEVAGVPAVNYDTDEGFGYGAAVEVYRYGEDPPYAFTLRPTLRFTTGGRRELTLFFDAPRLLAGGWRLTAFAGLERQIATPYYGVGNEVPFDPSLDADDGPDPRYYRYGRTRMRLSADVQRRVSETPLRLLVGAGATRVGLDLRPGDRGTTLLAEELAAAGEGPPEGWYNHVRGGLVWDSRDREVGTRRGVWSELLVQRVDDALGSESDYTRWTMTDRRYFPLTGRLVFANRLLLQGTAGDAPFHELQVVQSSFEQEEGLGGAKTLRGIPRNRYTGEGLFLWNAELRWRAVEFEALGRPFHVVLSGFLDSGRVWAGGVDGGELLSDLHHGYGGGVRLGMGENFVVALDAGHSSQATLPLYVGLGYLY